MREFFLIFFHHKIFFIFFNTNLDSTKLGKQLRKRYQILALNI